ncbi:hypothetical protein EON63_04510 [archaeon]|nr:MAG: hypothetical protein EON63_04510 [archaeon]
MRHTHTDAHKSTSPRIHKTFLAFSKSYDPYDKGGVGLGDGEMGMGMDTDMENYIEIAISRSMVSDHMPDQYYDALYKLLCNYYAKV